MHASINTVTCARCDTSWWIRLRSDFSISPPPCICSPTVVTQTWTNSNVKKQNHKNKTCHFGFSAHTSPRLFWNTFWLQYAPLEVFTEHSSLPKYQSRQQFGFFNILYLYFLFCGFCSGWLQAHLCRAKRIADTYSMRLVWEGNSNWDTDKLKCLLCF